MQALHQLLPAVTAESLEGSAQGGIQLSERFLDVCDGHDDSRDSGSAWLYWQL